MSTQPDLEDSYPLSPLQQGMLYNSLYAENAGVDIQQRICTLRENLDVSAFERAWQSLVGRHAVLRTSFRWEDLDEPVQQVHRDVQIGLQQQDWRDLPAEEQAEQLEAYLQMDRIRGFDLKEAPLMRLALFRMAKNDYRLIWSNHHAILDGRSIPILLEEVFTFYEAFLRGEDFELSLPRPYREYIEWLGRQDWSEAKAYWRKLLGGFTAATPLVVAQPPARAFDREGYGEQRIRLSHSVTQSLQSLTDRHEELTLATLVQGAWALLLSKYSGEEDVVFGAVRACRRSALDGATESMVGLFINTLPVRVRVPSGASLLPWLKQLSANQ